MSLPQNFRPMLACSTIPGLDNIEYPVYVLPKLDGIRCIMSNGEALSRSLKRIPNRHIRETLCQLNLDGLDGELMVKGDFESVASAVMSEDGKPDFYYAVFDDFSDPERPFSTRYRTAINKISLKQHVVLVDKHLARNASELARYWSCFVEQGYEGAIVRSIDGPYKYGRSTLNQGWMMKLKQFDDAEAIITGTEELMHNTNDVFEGELGQTKRSKEQDGLVSGGTLGSLVVEYNGKTFKIGSGFNDAQRAKLWSMRNELPGQLVKFKFQGLTRYGVPRFPIFLELRSKDDV